MPMQEWRQVTDSTYSWYPARTTTPRYGFLNTSSFIHGDYTYGEARAMVHFNGSEWFAGFTNTVKVFYGTLGLASTNDSTGTNANTWDTAIMRINEGKGTVQANNYEPAATSWTQRGSVDKISPTGVSGAFVLRDVNRLEYVDTGTEPNLKFAPKPASLYNKTLRASIYEGEDGGTQSDIDYYLSPVIGESFSTTLESWINNKVQRYVTLVKNETSGGGSQANHIVAWYGASSAAPPIFQVFYGFNLPSLTLTPGVHKLDVSWAAATGADEYSIYRNGSFVTSVAGNVNNYSFTQIPATSQTVEVKPYYEGLLPAYVGVAGELVSKFEIEGDYTNSITKSATPITPPTPAAPTISEGAKKRQVKVTIPAQASDQTGWKIQLNNEAEISRTYSQGDYTWAELKSGTYTVRIKSVWGAYESSWSPASSITIASPSVGSASTPHKGAPTTAYSTTNGNVVVDSSASTHTGNYYIAVSVNSGSSRTSSNESPPSPLPSSGYSAQPSAQKVTISKPSSCTGSDTWNIYAGTDKAVLKRFHENISSATTTQVLSVWSSPTVNETKAGRVVLNWTAPADIDAADTYTYSIKQANLTSSADTTTQAQVIVSGTTATTYTVSDLQTGWYRFEISVNYTDNDPDEIIVKEVTVNV